MSSFSENFIFLFSDSPDWTPIQDVPGDEERATIPDLVEGNQYEFRIRAVNKAGTSEPSEPTSPHTAKARKRMYI